MQHSNNETLINIFQNLNSLYFIKLLSQNQNSTIKPHKKSLEITRL